MNDPLVSIAVAMVGLFAGILGAYLTGRQQASLEDRKWRAVRTDELNKETRLAVAAVCRNISILVQNVQWFGWYAKYEPERINRKFIDDYNETARKIIPEIMASLVVVSALDTGKHRVINELASEAFVLDHSASVATTILDSSRNDALAAAITALNASNAYWRKMNETVANLFAQDNPRA